MSEPITTWHVANLGGGIPSRDVAETMAKDAFTYGRDGEGWWLWDGAAMPATKHVSRATIIITDAGYFEGANVSIKCLGDRVRVISRIVPETRRGCCGTLIRR